MKQNSDTFVPETVDEQIEQLWQPHSLHQEGHTPALDLTRELKAMCEEDAALIERVRERYAAQVEAVFAGDPASSQHPATLSLQEGEHTMQKQEDYLEEAATTLSSQSSLRPKRPRSIARRVVGLLAVAALCLLLVGGAFTLLHQVHTPAACNPCTASQPGKNDQQSATQPARQLYTVTMINHGENDQILSRVDASTGRTLWQFTIPAEITSSKPFGGSGDATEAIQVHEANGILYFQGTAHDGYYVYALHASDGTLAWKYKYDTDNYIPDLEVVLTNGAVYLSEHDFRTGKALIVSLNATTGGVLWQKHYDGVPMGTASTSRDLDLIAATASTLYATRAQTINQQDSWTLYALNAQTGAILWQKQHPEAVADADPDPTSWQLVNGVLYGGITVSPSAKQQTNTIVLSAYDAATGDQKWTTTLTGSTISNLQVVQGAIYAIANSEAGASVFYALHANDGSHIWQRTIQGTIGNALASGSLVIADGEIYMIVGSGNYPNMQFYLETLRASDGQPGWSYKPATDTTGLAGVTVDAEYVYLGASTANTVKVLDRRNGKLVKTITVGSGQQTDRSITQIFSFPAGN